MKQLSNKQLLLGISGSIAAYKACELVRLLRDTGATVRVVMTRAATEFVSPLTFQALSGNPVYRDLLDEQAEAAMGHIELARWADALIVAPASANCIARLAQGRADDLLSAICLATASPLAVAPAMNQQMWQDPATQENIQSLQQRSITMLGPAEGDQACGETGPGRMLEPAQLCEAIAGLFENAALDGLKVVISAGPTREPIDPVRYISNRSSGRMGFALAEAAAEAGATCVLVSGPVSLTTPRKVRRVDVDTAQQMYDAIMDEINDADIFIAAAAVSDYRVSDVYEYKLKKDAATLNLQLEHTVDILQTVATQQPKVFTVGFAAETRDIGRYAVEKLNRKSLNMIVANDVSRNDIGFDSDNNEVTVYWQGAEQAIPKMSKPKLARELVQLIAKQYVTG